VSKRTDAAWGVGRLKQGNLTFVQSNNQGCFKGNAFKKGNIPLYEGTEKKVGGVFL